MNRLGTLRSHVNLPDVRRVPEDGRRYELWDGELRIVPSPLPIHQIVLMRLADAIISHAKAHGGLACAAPFDIVLSAFDVVQPDLVYFGPRAAERVRPDEHVRFVPDLAVDILSPSSAAADRGPKRDLLARHGLAEHWIVDPEARHVEISVLRRGAYRRPRIISAGQCASITVPQLAVDLDALFDGSERRRGRRGRGGRRRR